MTESAANPIAATFAVLDRTEGSGTGELLIRALDVPREPIQRAAAELIVRQTTSRLRMELFRRIEQLPASVHELVRRSAPALEVTLRQLLLKGNSETRQLALRVIRVTQQYSLTGILIEMLAQQSVQDLDAILETLRSLVDTLYDQWQLNGADLALAIQAQRTTLLGHLDRGIARWEHLAAPPEVIESILILSEPQNAVVKRILWHGPDACRHLAAQRILDSRHPGVLRFAAESLLEAYPHPKVFEAIRTRRDPEFVAALLRIVIRRRSAQQLHHLRQIEHLEWLTPPYEILDALPPALHPALIAFVNATRVPRETKAEVQEWLLRFGTPEGKRAATEGMTLLEEAVIQEVVLDSLHSDDADVQAWATSQLRQHAIPSAFALLIERLDSPLPTVQQAARNELAGFNVERVLAMADDMELDDAHRAGILLMKVDLEAGVKLRRELAHPTRQKRLTAARRVARLGLQGEFLPAFVSLSQDNDPIARRTAIDVLATIPRTDAYRTLVQLLNDPHPRVREEAAQGLERWNELADMTAHPTFPVAGEIDRESDQVW
ncbi:MAG: HEAT repeat domain-containing protein [Planctomycetaceae bacterium]|nr:HEAT repeat domain-containing protein [Planctomycetaceae bacterium]